MAVAADEQVAQHARVVEQLDVLERARDAHAGDLVRRHAGDVAILVEQAPRGRLVEPRDHVEDRRLAGAVGADDGEDLALADLEIDVVDRLEAAEVERETVDLEVAHRLRSDFT